jgi:hypothetical protein
VVSFNGPHASDAAFVFPRTYLAIMRYPQKKSELGNAMQMNDQKEFGSNSKEEQMRPNRRFVSKKNINLLVNPVFVMVISPKNYWRGCDVPRREGRSDFLRPMSNYSILCRAFG